MKGYIKLRRGLIEHLPNISGSELKVYVALHFKANFKDGSVKTVAEDLTQDTGLKRKAVLRAIKGLADKNYINYKPGKNQYSLSQFDITNFSGGSPIGSPTGRTIGSPTGSPTSSVKKTQAQASEQETNSPNNIEVRSYIIEDKDSSYEKEENKLSDKQKEQNKKAINGITNNLLSEKPQKKKNTTYCISKIYFPLGAILSQTYGMSVRSHQLDKIKQSYESFCYRLKQGGACTDRNKCGEDIKDTIERLVKYYPKKLTNKVMDEYLKWLDELAVKRIEEAQVARSKR